MAGIFDWVATPRVPESLMDLSRSVKLSCNMAELVPVMLEEILPGDTFKVRTELLGRIAPMLSPIMERVNIDIHWYYVPNFLVWDNWNDHISGGEDQQANPEFPYFAIQENTKQYFNYGGLADYLGVPPVPEGTVITEPERISALPFRAYALIYNEFYRDQDLGAKIDFSKGDGLTSAAEIAELTTLRKRAWEKDYFTSARPSTTKGVQVQLPVETAITYKNPATATATGNPGAMTVIQNDQIATNGVSTGIDNIENIDGSITIDDLRTSNKLQEWLELAQRGGSRINEILKNYFGVKGDDLTLQRPRFLGSSRQPLSVSEVLNTAGDLDGSTLQPIGDYAGHGVTASNNSGFQHYFKYHGYVMGLLSVMPKTSYMQGLHRHWTKFDKYERYWPQFNGLSEQPIKRKEIFFKYDGSVDGNNSTFGYAPRYAEYKYGCSSVHGDFRKKSPTDDALSFWHMGRYFETEPVLNEQFVTGDPTYRMYAVKDETIDHLYIHMHHHVKAKRKMPKASIPTLV